MGVLWTIVMTPLWHTGSSISYTGLFVFLAFFCLIGAYIGQEDTPRFMAVFGIIFAAVLLVIGLLALGVPDYIAAFSFP